MDAFLKRFIWVIMVAPAVYLAVVWNRLPEKVAMHYSGLSGLPDRYGNKTGLLGVSALLLGMTILVYLLLTNIYRIDPKKYAADNKDRLRRIAYAVVIFLAGIHLLIIHSAGTGSMKFSMNYVLAATGLLFAVIGNYLPHLKQNYFAGLRIPWTLENAENWRRTHVLAGKLWFAGGLILAVLCLFLPALPAIIVFFTVMIIITVIPLVYSYRIFQQQKRTQR